MAATGVATRWWIGGFAAFAAPARTPSLPKGTITEQGSLRAGAFPFNVLGQRVDEQHRGVDGRRRDPRRSPAAPSVPRSPPRR